MSARPPIPSVGQVVTLRQRLYRIEQSVGLLKRGDSTIARLACFDDDAQGQTLEVLWEKELDQQIVSGEAWESISFARVRPTEQVSIHPRFQQRL